MRYTDLLFRTHDLSDFLRAREANVQEMIDEVRRDQFLATADDTLVEHMLSQLEVVPIELHEERTEMAQQESRMDVSSDRRRNPFGDPGPIYVASLRVTVTAPYTGDHELWHCRPSSWRLTGPRGRVRQPGPDGVGYLEIDVERPADFEPTEFKQRLDDTLKDVRFYLDSQRKQVEEHNRMLPNRIREAVAHRRKRLEQHAAVRKVLNIPLRQRAGVPSIEPIQAKRKLVRPLPPVPSVPPEPGIRDEDYDHILKVIRHEGRTFETTPATFAIHHEEGLRDIILAHLNGHYEGDATGETFRGAGKTDIRIEVADRAALVSECKVWRGPKQLNEALEQLLGYLIWRDCKAALVLFNKNVAGFTGIQDRISQTLSRHPNCLRMIDSGQPGEWRFLFRPTEDPDRRIAVHVFLFNLYLPQRSENCASRKP